VKHAFAAIKSEFGTTGHVLLNNVGGGLTNASNKSMLEMNAADFEAVWRKMCLSAFLATQQVLPEMIANGEGTVLFTSSTAAFRGSAQSPAFPTAMAGVRMLAQSVAKAHSKSGVHVVHLRIDGVVDNDKIREQWKGVTDAQLVDPAGIADLYFFASQQKSRGFINELDIRPAVENWTL
jgi:NAD(P)-dependent dehydrogenase (short-subunit alcohol dehydrogenase family)